MPRNTLKELENLSLTERQILFKMKYVMVDFNTELKAGDVRTSIIWRIK